MTLTMKDDFDIDGDPVLCPHCEEWYDSNSCSICAECDEAVCYKCEDKHVCEEVTP